MSDTATKGPTPGPWRAWSSPSGESGMLPDDWTVSDLKGEDVASVIVLDNPDAAEANARLIAEAPAMALMLKLLSYGLARFEISPTAPLTEFCFGGMRYVWSGDYSATIGAIGWEKAKAAIRKAEGK